MGNGSESGGNPGIETPTPPTITPMSDIGPAQAPISSTSTANSTSINPAHSGTNHISSGALAGGIVGAAVGAALLTFVVTSLICIGRMRSRDKGHKRHLRPRHGGSSDGASGDKTGPAMAVSELDDDVWKAYLPQPADDMTMEAAVKSLFDGALLHVENFYSRNAAQIGPDAYDHLASIRTAARDTSASALLSDTTSAWPVIKHCLSYMLAESILPTSHPTTSLLPLGWSVAPEGDQIQRSKTRNLAKRQAISTWRQLTIYLNPTPYSEPTLAAHRDRAVAAFVERFETAFKPWQPDKSAKAHQDLMHIVGSAVDVAILIFGQPSEYDFTWEPVIERSSDGTGSSLTVTPGFARIASGHGKTLIRQHVIMGKVVERV